MIVYINTVYKKSRKQYYKYMNMKMIRITSNNKTDYCDSDLASANHALLSFSLLLIHSKYPSLIIAASSGLVSSRVWVWTLLLTLLTGRLLAWLGRRRPSVGTGHHPVPLFRCWSAGCLSGCTQATSTSWLNHAAARKTSWQTPSWRLTLHRRSKRLKHCRVGGRQRDD